MNRFLAATILLTASSVSWPASTIASTEGLSIRDHGPAACRALQGAELLPNAISLRTRGAIVRTTRFVVAKTEGPASSGEEGFCDVDGAIRPLDPNAPEILFNVALPARWNGKAVHLMGGGYDGTVVKGSGPIVGAERLGAPVQRGYVGFGSDAGHRSTSTDWARNDEALENFAGDQLRKTRDTAVAIMFRYYGRNPKRTFSAGGSGGGREALYVADRWPMLYDGVIAFYPVWSAVGAFSGWIDTAQTVARPGAWSNVAQQRRISDTVIAQCDQLDGLKDGIVGNIAACHFDSSALRCKASQSEGCLSDLQLRTLVDGYGRVRRLPFALSHGVDAVPATNTLNAGAAARMGSIPPGVPVTSNMAFGAVIGDMFVRDFVTRDPSVNVFNFKMSASPATSARMRYLSSRMDVDPAMRRFVAKGGRIILVHGDVDQLHSADWSDEFYLRFARQNGVAVRSTHLQYYRVPGYDHGAGLPGEFQLSVDLLPALERWVETGAAPSMLIAQDVNASHPGRTRPLCQYPLFPRYRGTGDTASAASFVCASS